MPWSIRLVSPGWDTFIPSNADKLDKFLRRTVRLSAMTSLVYENDEVQVLYQDAPGSRLLVTFAPLDFKADGKSFWGERYVGKAKRATLGFVAKRNNWFPSRSILPCYPSITSILSRFSEIMTYGSSMGGHGALKYGAFVGASRALAFAPQYSINPDDNVTSPLFTKFYDPVLNADMCIVAKDLCPLNIIVFDPMHGFDRKNFWFIRNLSETVVPVKAFGAGHNCIWLIAKSERASAFLDACHDQRIIDLRKQIATYRRQLEARAEPIIRKAARTHPSWARRLYHKYQAQFDGKPPLTYK